MVVQLADFCFKTAATIADLKDSIETLPQKNFSADHLRQLRELREKLVAIETASSDVVKVLSGGVSDLLVAASLPETPTLVIELVQIGKWVKFLGPNTKVDEIHGWAIGAADFGVYPSVVVLQPSLIESITLSHDANVTKVGGTEEDVYRYIAPESGTLTLGPSSLNGYDPQSVGAERLFKSKLKHRAAWDSSEHKWGSRALSCVEKVVAMWQAAKTVKLHVLVKGICNPFVVDITPATLGWEPTIRDGERD